MTLDEAIKTEENIAEENQRVVDTGIVFDDVTIDMLYCDDTEVIEEHLANYQRCAEEHRQLAGWLKELKERKLKCKWIRYDYRTICPQNHDIDNPFWRIPENAECLKYCPYCGKEIEVAE